MLALFIALAAAAATPPFQSLSHSDFTAAHVAGTGCVWGVTAKGPWLFAAADDRATVKRGGRLVALRPAANAADMFPFTYDRWAGDTLVIAVRKTGTARAFGSEASNTPASLDVTEAGRTRRWAGVLQCGS